MEDILHELASHVALVAEFICVLCIAVGAILTIAAAIRAIAEGKSADLRTRHAIFVGFARWIILALEFALGADIARTAIAPTWDDIGQLAAIAAIRTFLNYFLEKDVEERMEPEAVPPKAPGTARLGIDPILMGAPAVNLSRFEHGVSPCPPMP